MKHYVAALDIGSSKVALAVGEKTDTGIRIVSYYDAPSAGIECGEINNDGKVAEIVRGLIEQAEAGLPDKLTEVTVGISGRTLHSRDVFCSSIRKNPRSSIGETEVRQITKERYRETLGDGEIVFEAIPQRYDTDDRIGINESELVGMEASQIDAYFKLFGGRKAIIDRRASVLQQSGLSLHKAVLAPIASARAVLSRSEMESGVVLIDMGKDTTEVTVVKDDIVRHVAIIPFGGESITGDIKTVAGITRHYAEIVKLLHGRCCTEYAIENRKLILKNENGLAEGEVALKLLAQVVEARMSEILETVRYSIEKSGYAGQLPAGYVITGGTAHLENLLQLAEALLGTKVRLAAPQGSITSDSVEDAFDVYASTAVGLVLETLTPKLSHALTRDPEPVNVPIEEPSTPEPANPPAPKGGRRGLFGRGRKGDNTDDGQLSLFEKIFDATVSTNDQA